VSAGDILPASDVFSSPGLYQRDAKFLRYSLLLGQETGQKLRMSACLVHGDSGSRKNTVLSLIQQFCLKMK
jgi:hypothetical protein